VPGAHRSLREQSALLTVLVSPRTEVEQVMEPGAQE